MLLYTTSLKNEFYWSISGEVVFTPIGMPCYTVGFARTETGAHCAVCRAMLRGIK